MGLALVRKFAEMHNGEIEVQSEEGKGSVFTLTLPVNYENPRNTGASEDTSNIPEDEDGDETMIVSSCVDLP